MPKRINPDCAFVGCKRTAPGKYLHNDENGKVRFVCKQHANRTHKTCRECGNPFCVDGACGL